MTTPHTYDVVVVGGGAVGAALGWLSAHALLYFGADAVEAAVGLRFDAGRVVGSEGAVVALVTVSGALAGVLPGVQAYRTDVADSLRLAE